MELAYNATWLWRYTRYGPCVNSSSDWVRDVHIVLLLTTQFLRKYLYDFYSFVGGLVTRAHSGRQGL